VDQLDIMSINLDMIGRILNSQGAMLNERRQHNIASFAALEAMGKVEEGSTKVYSMSG